MAETHQPYAYKQCWHCLEIVAGDLIFCPHCQTIQPLTSDDPFQRLHCEPTYRLSLPQLEASYANLMKLVHPDRYVAASAREKLYAQQHASAINEAFKMLKDPYERACLLLEQVFSVTFEADKASPEILMEMFEWHERLGMISTESERQELQTLLEEGLMAQDAAMEVAFQHHDAHEFLEAAKKYRYLTKIAQDTRAKVFPTIIH